MAETILIIDDEEGIVWSLRKAFEREGYRVAVAASAEDGLKKAGEFQPSVIFLDIRLPGMDGLTALGKLKTLAPDAAVVIITAHGNLNTAVKAVEGGAFDYLAKPFDLDVALDAVKRGLQRKSHGQNEPPKSAQREDDGEIVGKSIAIQNVFKRIALVAPTNACVMITGESGTGKDLVARALHAHSQRRDKIFLPIHVAAFNPNLVESELFGHVRGAFTGADKARSGLLALADGGTVFLDELADIPLPTQAKLLRVLERQEIQPVGGAETVQVNIRLISATNASLDEAVKEGKFRHDLFYRLNVYPIHIPPLRERVDDILILAEHFLRKFASGSLVEISLEARQEMAKRHWPGNVRELRNALEHAFIVSRGETIRPEHLPAPMNLNSATITDKLDLLLRDWVRDQIAKAGSEEPADLHEKMLNQLEPALLGEVLARLQGNRLAAARGLGLARATVRKLLRKYDLDDKSTGDEADEE
jgi:two-component system nitrogen regulation response regulator GlnG